MHKYCVHKKFKKELSNIRMIKGIIRQEKKIALWGQKVMIDNDNEFFVAGNKANMIK